MTKRLILEGLIEKITEPVPHILNKMDTELQKAWEDMDFSVSPEALSIYAKYVTALRQVRHFGREFKRLKYSDGPDTEETAIVPKKTSEPDRAYISIPKCPRCGSTRYLDASQSYDCLDCGKSW